MELSARMQQALKDVPITNEILNHGVDHGESMCWVGNSGKIYMVNTLTALVKRGQLQFERSPQRMMSPCFVVKAANHQGKYWDNENEYWLR